MGKVFIGVIISLTLILMASGWMLWDSMNQRGEADHMREILEAKTEEQRENSGSRISSVGNKTGEVTPASQDTPGLPEIRRLLEEIELSGPIRSQQSPY